MPLTDLQCRSAACPLGLARARFADGHGMYLEVQPNGARYWRLKYRYAGKEKRLSLGVYPDVPDPGNMQAMQAILDDRERPYYEHRWLLAA
jgi:hypothetical protein